MKFDFIWTIFRLQMKFNDLNSIHVQSIMLKAFKIVRFVRAFRCLVEKSQDSYLPGATLLDDLSIN